MEQINTFTLILKQDEKEESIKNVTKFVTYLNDGEFVLLPNMAFFVGSLKIHVCKVFTSDNNILYFSINGGIISFENNVCTVYSESFESKEEIDIDRANKAKERSEEKLKIATSNVDIKKAKIGLAKALNRINLYNIK